MSERVKISLRTKAKVVCWKFKVNILRVWSKSQILIILSPAQINFHAYPSFIPLSRRRIHDRTTETAPPRAQTKSRRRSPHPMGGEETTREQPQPLSTPPTSLGLTRPLHPLLLLLPAAPVASQLIFVWNTPARHNGFAQVGRRRLQWLCECVQFWEYRGVFGWSDVWVFYAFKELQCWVIIFACFRFPFKFFLIFFPLEIPDFWKPN